jgi:hypothetical protein
MNVYTYRYKMVQVHTPPPFHPPRFLQTSWTPTCNCKASCTSCTPRKCRIQLDFCPNHRPHSVHENGRSPVCVRWCLNICIFCLNRALQFGIGQANGRAFKFLCVFTWARNVILLANCFEQCWHENDWMLLRFCLHWWLILSMLLTNLTPQITQSQGYWMATFFLSRGLFELFELLEDELDSLLRGRFKTGSPWSTGSCKNSGSIWSETLLLLLLFNKARTFVHAERGVY